jgi:hypothetical protein
MRLVSYEGKGHGTRFKIWGEHGAAERVYVKGQEDEAGLEEAEEEIEVKVLSHSPQHLRKWLEEVADREESAVFNRGRDVGRSEAYENAFKYGLVALLILYLLHLWNS